ncbi:glycoside hydrolase family 2 TIM barrel-domain containing protein [Saccharicrinis sp. GN24d3]|uniref:glycoside hydrolase family 2 TIM barrel-domain containing protein n=1 Tax=Saccharicrinis sp. GN24d3 TaxID=3458416 RepID=UPI004036A711
MKDSNCKTFLWLMIISLSIPTIVAQRKVFLSGQDAATAIDWEFKISDGRNSGFWTTIPVPSNWETEGFGYYLYGMDKMEKRTPPLGYYRHSFSFSKQKAKRYFITFQGAMTDTKVTLNNKEVGFHQGGFTEFKYEVSDALKDGENRLEVEVNSTSTDASLAAAERYADFWLFSGIFRPVFIDEVPDEFIENVAIDAQMTGDFKMWVYTNGVEEANTISAQVYDAKGHKVGKSFSAKIQGEKTGLVSGFDDVGLWSHEFPQLYSVEVQLKNKNKVLHTYTQKFGFRTFEVRDHDGFYLNGKRILLKAANMHSFSPETGRTLAKADMEENIRIMQNLNMNCVRPCHYPPDTYLFDLCDSLGLLCMDETTGWVKPLATPIGTQIVKEIVTRDVNHPSIILWSNGNHNAHNPELDLVFHQWDIQKRRPLKNAPKNGDIFRGYTPEWDIVNTTYYPNYETVKCALFEQDHIYLPNETLHALYDGGGGANLKTYWDMFEASEVGGGLTIWALFDEGLMRTDMGYIVDNQGAKAADGIIGPHGEWDGSSYAVREIWSPVVIGNKNIGVDFDGTLEVHNKFSFTNLNQCHIEWKLINFANPDGTPNGHRTVASGKIDANVAAGEKGTLSFEIPESYVNNDALGIQVYDTKGIQVYDKRMPITTSKRPDFRGSFNAGYKQSKVDAFTFQRYKTTLKFDRNSGILLSVLDNGKLTSLANYPFLTFGEADTTLVNSSVKISHVSVNQEGNDWIIEAKDTKGFDYLKWTLKANGEIALDYAYTLDEGKYHYAGIGIEVRAEDVLRKRFLGQGPERIWSNRKEGGVLDVYSVEKRVNIPGQVYNAPAFEGCFAPWNWAVFYLDNHLNLGFKNQSDVILGVLNPTNAKDPKQAQWTYPTREGFFFFDYISAVGSKWKKPTEFGPDAQPHMINQQVKGSVSMFINWNKPTVKAKRVDMELE